MKLGVERRIRFVPASAAATPGLIEELCARYRTIEAEASVAPLVAAATFILDFLCIHPFRDGNGRTARILTTMLLLRLGSVLPRYVSLERIVEESKDDYDEALPKSSRGWIEGKNELAPWWNYFLALVKNGYRELEQEYDRTIASASKTELIRIAVLAHTEPFTVRDIAGSVPDAGVPLIRYVLNELKKEGLVESSGTGKAARWRRIHRDE